MSVNGAKLEMPERFKISNVNTALVNEGETPGSATNTTLWGLVQFLSGSSICPLVGGAGANSLAPLHPVTMRQTNTMTAQYAMPCFIRYHPADVAKKGSGLLVDRDASTQEPSDLVAGLPR